MNTHHPAISGQVSQRCHQLGELGLAAGEGEGIPRQASGRGRREGARRALVPGGEDRGGRGLAAGCGDEQLGHRPGQA
jgi:hypothetical protein